MAAESEFARAKVFLAPVLSREGRINAQGHGQSIIDCLASANLKAMEPGYDARTFVIRRALALLLELHITLCKVSDDEVRKLLSQPERRQVVEGLLDLISLEGIYPDLSPGVGIPIGNRVKSVFEKGFVAKLSQAGGQPETKNYALLDHIVLQLDIIVSSKDGGLKSALENRIFVDLIAALGELLFGPFPVGNHDALKALWDVLLAEISVSILLRTFTSLLHSKTPEWLRVHFSKALSALPMRPMGVAQTIAFIAKSAPEQEHFPQSADLAPASPSISLDVLDQISKLLSSVPRSVTPEDYFQAIGSQLLDLLLSEEVDMRRAASLVIGTGILGRRIYGAPGSVGWKIFVEPLQRAIDPNLAARSGQGVVNHRGGDASSREAVPKSSLRKAIFSLSALTTIHPNPGLTQRLLKPLVLPLWGLLCLLKTTHTGIDLAKECYKMLAIYLKTSDGSRDLVNLADNLTWEYHGTVSPYSSPDFDCRDEQISGDIGKVLANVDLRIGTFLQLLRSTGPDQSDISDIFLHIIKRWLEGDKSAEHESSSIIAQRSIAKPAQHLCYAKLTQNMLEEYKDILTKDPARLLQFIEQIVGNYLRNVDEQYAKILQLKKPSLSSLASISTSNVESDNPGVDEDDVEAVSTSLSLILTVFSSPSFYIQVEDLSFLTSLLTTLSRLEASSSPIHPAVRAAAANVSTLLSIYASSSAAHQSLPTQAADPSTIDRKKHSLSLTYLSDDLAPVRAEGLSLLSGLIKSSSPVLDVPTTCILLISLLQDDEEYIYLSAIKSLTLLASKHSRTVLRMLVEKYIDRAEEVGLDQRLRVGEALLRAIESLGRAFVEESAKLVGEGMLEIASRRVKRSKQRTGKQEGVATTHGGDSELDLDRPDSEEKSDPVQGRLANVLEGWEGKEGEDMRIRASAMSILGAAIETNIAGLGASLTSTAVDLAISVLKMEAGPGREILRRAAALVILNFIRALGESQEEGRQLGFGLAGQSLYDMIEVIEYIKAAESDEILEGHLDSVLRELQGVRVSGQYVRGLKEQDFNPLQSGQLAGLSVNPEASLASRPRIEEIE